MANLNIDFAGCFIGSMKFLDVPDILLLVPFQDVQNSTIENVIKPLFVSVGDNSNRRSVGDMKFLTWYIFLSRRTHVPILNWCLSPASPRFD